MSIAVAKANLTQKIKPEILLQFTEAIELLLESGLADHDQFIEREISVG